MRTLILVSLSFVVACDFPIKSIDHARPFNARDPDALRRCDDLRKWKDVLVGLGAGGGVAAGASGLSALGYTHADSRRHIAELSLSIAIVAAFFVAESSAMGNAYTEEGCTDRFNGIRESLKKPESAPAELAQPQRSTEDAARMGDAERVFGMSIAGAKTALNLKEACNGLSLLAERISGLSAVKPPAGSEKVFSKQRDSLSADLKVMQKDCAATSSADVDADAIRDELESLRKDFVKLQQIGAKPQQ